MPNHTLKLRRLGPRATGTAPLAAPLLPRELPCEMRVEIFVSRTTFLKRDERSFPSENFRPRPSATAAIVGAAAAAASSVVSDFSVAA